MKQLTQSEIRKNGKVYKNVSSPATEGTMKQVTDIVEKDGTFSISTDGGKTYSPAGGSGSTINYTKLSGDVKFNATYPYAFKAFFVNTDATTWAENETLEQKALASKSDLGLVIGNAYEITVNIDGTSQVFSGTAVDGTLWGFPGLTILAFEQDDIDLVIYDHVDFNGVFPKAGNGALIAAEFYSAIASATITDFSGTLQIVSPATIINSAIKVNSAVTMYINSSAIVRGTKTDGSITLTASKGGTVSYEMEILDTPTEGLFEIVNAYVPTVPNYTSELSNDSGFLTKDNFVAGDNVTITDENGNLKISVPGGSGGATDYNNLSNIPVINQDLSESGFTPVKDTYYRHTGTTDRNYTKGVIYKCVDVGSTSESLEMFEIASIYDVRMEISKAVGPLLPAAKNITNASTNVSITGSASPYFFTVTDSDVSSYKFVRLYPMDEDTETWLNEHTLSSIITEDSGKFTFKVDTATLPTAFGIKYVVESFL